MITEKNSYSKQQYTDKGAETMSKMPSSNAVCPGSCDENPHTLQAISQETGNSFCPNNKCYFIYMDSDKNHYWEHGFDPMNTKSFVKSESLRIFKKNSREMFFLTG